MSGATVLAPARWRRARPGWPRTLAAAAICLVAGTLAGAAVAGGAVVLIQLGGADPAEDGVIGPLMRWPALGVPVLLAAVAADAAARWLAFAAVGRARPRALAAVGAAVLAPGPWLAIPGALSRVAIAAWMLVVTAALLRWRAETPGSRRRGAAWLRGLAAAGAIALAIAGVLAYQVTHNPLAIGAPAEGGPGTGAPDRLDVRLSNGSLVTATVLGADPDVPGARLRLEHRGRAGPIGLGSGEEAGARLRLLPTGCPAVARVERVWLRYRVLGIERRSRLELPRPLAARC